MANALYRGTTPGASDFGLGTAVAMLGIIAVVGYILYLLVLVPAFAVAVEMYAGIAAAPSSFTAIGWTNLLGDTLWGVVVGFIVGLGRLRWRSKIVEELVAIFASRTGVSATRIGLWCVLLHALIGAISGAIVGLMGLISPVQIFGDAPTVLTDHAQAAVKLLTSAGFFNAGGAPPGGSDIYFLFFVIIVFIVVSTLLLSAIVIPMLAAVAGIFISGGISGAAQGGGQVIGSSLLLAIAGILTTNEGRPYVGKDETLAAGLARFKQFGVALVAGLRTGLTVGMLNALVVVACLYFVRARVAAVFGPPPNLELGATAAGLHSFPTGIALSSDGKILLVRGEGVGCWDVRGLQKRDCPSEGRDVRVNLDGTSREYCPLLHIAGGYLGYGFTVYSPDCRIRAYGAKGESKLVDDYAKREVQLDVPPVERFHAANWATAGDVLAVSFEQLVPHFFGIMSLYDDQVMLLRPSNGKVLWTLTGFTDRVESLDFNADGTMLATAEGPRIKLWQVSTGQLLRTLSGHKSRVYGLAFSRDGRLLATTADTVRLWDVVTGRGLAAVPAKYGDRVIFTSDNQLVVAGYEKNKLWSLR